MLVITDLRTNDVFIRPFVAKVPKMTRGDNWSVLDMVIVYDKIIGESVVMRIPLISAKIETLKEHMKRNLV